MNKKSFFGGLAIGLAGILAVGAVGWFTKGFREWKKEKPVIDNPIEDSTTSDEAGVYDENGNNLADGNIHAMPMRLTFTGAKTLASNTSNDITTNEDGTKEVTVQATLNRDIEMLFDWSLEWTDSTATGTVTEYVTVTPQSDGSAIATVKMLQKFTKEITLTCSSREIVGVYGSCSIDCRPDVTIESVEMSNTSASPQCFLLYDTIESANSASSNLVITDDSALSYNGKTYNLSFDLICANGSLHAADIFDLTGSATFEFADLSVVDGYGFDEIGPYSFELGTNWSTSVTRSRLAVKTSFSPISITDIAAAFTYDESKGYNAESFYTQGVALLKEKSTLCPLKVSISLKMKEEYGGIFINFEKYFSVDISGITGLSIDLNGGENIVF